MKIGVLTITNGANYGNRLQNYASQQVLKSIGFEVETITNFTNQKVEKKYKSIIKKAISPIYLSIDSMNINKLNNIVRNIKFEKFTEKHINSSIYTISKGNVHKDIVDYYDYFICGSDQVWNPNFYFNSEIDFLTFAKKGQKIAYAPSFGVSEIPKEYVGKYKEWINGLDYISVRENAGKKIIKDLTGRESTVLIDPTLMLSKREWLEIANKPKWLKDKKYILTYFLGDKDIESKERISSIAKENNLEIINLMDENNKNIYSVDPSEFIYLINNCELMCTDSFHGAVFSLIMKTPFIVFERKDKHVSMNSRIDTLLNLFRMRNRLDSNIDNKDIFRMNFENVDKIIHSEREKAIKYLENALNV